MAFHGIERCAEPCRLVRCLPFRKRRRHPMGSICTLNVWIAGLAKAKRMSVLRPGDVNSLARQQGTRVGPSSKDSQRRTQLLQVCARNPFQVRHLSSSPPFDLGRIEPSDSHQHVDSCDVAGSSESGVAHLRYALLELALVVRVHGTDRQRSRTSSTLRRTCSRATARSVPDMSNSS
jgi:hypothetical protein